MATNIVLHNIPVTTTLTVNSVVYHEAQGKIALTLDEGNYTGTIAFAGNTSTVDLVVPKATADIVAEQVAAQIDAAVAAATAGMITSEAAQLQVETALETSQGYIDVKRVEEVSVYNTGQNSNETLTTLKLHFQIDTSVSPTATKVKLYYSDGSDTVVEDISGQLVYDIYQNTLNGSPAPTLLNKIEVKAGNNKVIDKLELDNLFTTGLIPTCPECPVVFNLETEKQAWLSGAYTTVHDKDYTSITQTWYFGSVSNGKIMTFDLKPVKDKATKVLVSLDYASDTNQPQHEFHIVMYDTNNDTIGTAHNYLVLATDDTIVGNSYSLLLDIPTTVDRIEIITDLDSGNIGVSETSMLVVL